MSGSEETLSRENVLWEPPTVIYYLRRDERYNRIRERSQRGIPTITALIYADTLVQLYQRFAAPDKLALNVEELETFHIVPVDRATGKAYASAYRVCLASARNRGTGAPPEPWFVWSVALNYSHGCRILSNDRARYAGLVAPDDLV